MIAPRDDTPTIDAEFEALIPPLTDEEFAGLGASVIREGCRDPLVVWRGTLIDGHHRLRICLEHGVAFETAEVDLLDRDAVLVWIIRHQFARRNLTPFQRSELALKLEPLIAAKAKGNQRAGGNAAGVGRQNSDKPLDTKRELARAAGVSHDTIVKVKVIEERADEATKVRLRVGETSINAVHSEIKRRERDEKRAKKREQNAQRVQTTERFEDLAGAFSTIVADPPWSYADEGDADDYLGRSKPDYATMSIGELMKLPVERLAASDAHIYLWTTNRSMYKTFDLAKAWGFRPTTILTWPKPSFGLGNYFRGQTEHVVFGVRGSFPTMRKNASTLLPAWPRGKGGHSSKPPEFLDFVESCSPGPYLELFSRRERPGWRSWGADAGATP